MTSCEPPNDSDPECVLYPDGKKYRQDEVRVQCEANDSDPSCVLHPDGNRYKPGSYRHPRVYMGPGIWFDRHPQSPTAGKVHIRLSHTHSQINGLTDYSEE